MDKKTVVLCDDHNIVRAGLRQIVESFGDFEVLDDVSSGEALFPLFMKQVPDVLLLDISLPGRSGLEVLKQIQSMYPQIAVLALSMYPEDQFAIRMVKAGNTHLHDFFQKSEQKQVVIVVRRIPSFVFWKNLKTPKIISKLTDL